MPLACVLEEPWREFVNVEMAAFVILIARKILRAAPNDISPSRNGRLDLSLDPWRFLFRLRRSGRGDDRRFQDLRGRRSCRGKRSRAGSSNFTASAGSPTSDVSAGEIVDPLDAVGLRLGAKAFDILADGGIDGPGFAGIEDDFGEVWMFILFFVQSARIPNAAENADCGGQPEDCERAFHL